MYKANIGFADFMGGSGIDIEKALLKIDEVASNQEGIAAEEALILRGYAF
jgi:exocyst complex protein 7